MARKSSLLMGELSALLDNYTQLAMNDIEATIANCSVFLLEATASKREADIILNRFRVFLSRNYTLSHWKTLGIPRPSIFYRSDAEGYTYFMTKGQRGLTSYD